MEKRFLAMAAAAVFLISLTGCSTAARKQSNLELEGLKNKVSVLESEVTSKDEEINSLKESLAKATQQVEANAGSIKEPAKIVPEVKSRPNTEQIQIALKTAGYNPGAIDGKMGNATVNAIKAFQKANNLNQDGKVGKKTWELLGKYLEKKSE